MSLLADLEKLGDGLTGADLPADPRKLLGALIYYVENRTLEPPAPANETQAAELHEERSEIARQRDQIEQLEAQLSAAKAPPTPPAPPVPAGGEGGGAPLAPVPAGAEAVAQAQAQGSVVAPPEAADPLPPQPPASA